jgi:hypothetical protein
MTAPTNHRVSILNRFGNLINSSVVRVKDLGNGVAEVDVETNFYIEAAHDHPATYITPSSEAKGHYRVSGSEFTEQLIYVYKGTFTRAG